MTGAVKNQVVRLDGLQSHPRNYNTHSAAQIAKLAKSLQTFGQVRSIVTWHNTILAGHGVVLAARTLSWDTLRADDVSHLSEDAALAYVIADNELARQSDPDQAQLAAILEELQAREPLLVEAAGYSAQELEQLLQSLKIILPDPQPQQEPYLASEQLIEIRCTSADLYDFQGVLNGWAERPTVAIDIS